MISFLSHAPSRYNLFNPNWVSDSEFFFRDAEGIQKGNLNTSSTELIISEEFYVSFCRLEFYYCIQSHLPVLRHIIYRNVYNVKLSNNAFYTFSPIKKVAEI